MSELFALTVPKWGMSMEEGDVVEWRVALGDTLAVGDEFCDIETSKIVNAAESTAVGTLVRIVGEPGQTLEVGMLLGVVADGQSNEAEIDAFVASFVPGAGGAALAQSSISDGSPTTASTAQTAAESTAQPQVATPKKAPSILSEGPDDSAVKASVVARRIATANNINLHNVSATGRRGRISKSDVEQAAGIRVIAAASSSAAVVPASGPARSMADESEVAATPVARRLAKNLGINLNDVTPTGKRGRVSRDDVELAAKLSGGLVEFREEKLSGMRKTIAARLSESKQTIPHYRVSVDIEIDSLLQQRKYMNDELGHSLSVNDFVIKACASALQRVPAVNVQFTGDAIRYYEQVDISMAVAIEGGLITPVIRNVGAKSLPQIAAESADLARRAQSGTLGLDEFSGGTFSISNLGMFGVDQFDAVINPPQAAILAVAAGKRKPVMHGESIVPATVMRVSLSSDHRAIDGATSAQFLRELTGLLENPAAMLL